MVHGKAIATLLTEFLKDYENFQWVETLTKFKIKNVKLFIHF